MMWMNIAHYLVRSTPSNDKWIWLCIEQSSFTKYNQISYLPSLTVWLQLPLLQAVQTKLFHPVLMTLHLKFVSNYSIIQLNQIVRLNSESSTLVKSKWWNVFWRQKHFHCDAASCIDVYHGAAGILVFIILPFKAYWLLRKESCSLLSITGLIYVVMNS